VEYIKLAEDRVH